MFFLLFHIFLFVLLLCFVNSVLLGTPVLYHKCKICTGPFLLFPPPPPPSASLLGEWCDPLFCFSGEEALLLYYCTTVLVLGVSKRRREGGHMHIMGMGASLCPTQCVMCREGEGRHFAKKFQERLLKKEKFGQIC